MKSKQHRSNNTTGFEALQDTILAPVKLLIVELGNPIPKVSLSPGAAGQDYKRALTLARLHGYPLGMVELGERDLDSASHVRAIWQALEREINAHLVNDGLPPLNRLPPDGILTRQAPACLENRAKLLANGPLVSVVIPTRDRTQDLEECLCSLEKQDYPSFEIIVVDNAPSNNATLQLVQSVSSRYANIRYVLEEIPGLSQGRNRGLQAARGEIVVFTDDDIVAEPDWLSTLVAGFSAGENVACVTGLILPKQLDTPAQVWCEEHGGFGKGYSRRIFDLDKNRPKDMLFPYRVSQFGSGANMAFKISILRELGGFDPVLGAGTLTRSGSEFPPLFKVITSGRQIVYDPSAIIYHAHHREFEKFASQFYGYGVGFTAFLTKCILENPIHLFRLLVKIPAGLVFIFSPYSEKNKRKTDSYPKELNGLEMKGLLYGPIAYFRSRKICKSRYIPLIKGDLQNSL